MKVEDLYLHLELKDDSDYDSDVIPEDILESMKSEINEVLAGYGFAIRGVSNFDGFKAFFEGVNSILSKRNVLKENENV